MRPGHSFQCSHMALPLKSLGTTDLNDVCGHEMFIQYPTF